MRSTWTDERMDDLNRKVDALHAEMHAEFRAVRTEMGSRLDGLHRAMVTMTIAMTGTMIAGFATLFATQL
jgi:predicted site-specific integrase-resolvase